MPTIRTKRRRRIDKILRKANTLFHLWKEYGNYRGIDYAGHTTVNRDGEYRYGIIPVHSLHQWIWDDFEADYGDPHCPKCGNEAVAGDSEGPDRDDYEILHHACGDYACDSCKLLFDGEDAFGEDAFGDEPLCHTLDDGTYKAMIDSSNDAWVFKSPYYTHAQFCSPCAPGACYLENPCASGAKCYCFGHEMFDGKAPYPVFSVKTGRIVRA